MATKEQVKGVTAHKEAPIVIPKPHNPKRQFMTYEEAELDSKRYRKANQAADEARAKVLAEGLEDDENKPVAGPSESDKKLVKLRKELAQAEEKLAAKPESKPLQKKVKEISEALEVAEAEAE